MVNSLGRRVPKRIGKMSFKPFTGAYGRLPEGRRYAPPMKARWDKVDKIVGGIEEAIKKVGLKDGMTISFHHQMRNGDHTLNRVVKTIAEMGLKNITLAPTSMFPVHNEILPLMRDGTISWINGGSVKSDIGRAVSRGELFGKPIIVRSHGGRTRAIEEGSLHVDVAFISVPVSDPFGNANGVGGKHPCGALGFPWIDSVYADKVVLVTDTIEEYPLSPISIPEYRVDYVAQVEEIGDPKGIEFGTTKITTDPKRLGIASTTVDIIEALGMIRDGLSFQAGAGGISLAVVKFLHERMVDRKVVGSFALGGTTEFVVKMLEEGVVKKILDAQAFDLKAVESLRENRDHVEISHYHYGNPFNMGNAVNKLDFCFLGATEVDTDFNVNVNTYSNGYLMQATGGHQDASAGAKVTFVTCPVARKNVPVIRDRVTTVTSPGETVDIVVTDAGVAINPRREDLIKRFKESSISKGIKLLTIEELKEISYSAAGEEPLEAKTTDEIVALIEYRDGSIIDAVWRVAEE
ncbi:MAG: citrate lyase subunit alpha [Thermoplasmata archaeon]|nr:citrate lyase subunit alpha [Thermoplasmata archaeon]